ncbi:MAG TPA: ectoine hydroxylase [Gallionella sp.]|nr:ectoine hydroxylase [Gallionella sp.]
MVEVVDKYPSRAGRAASLKPRLDPVVYAPVSPPLSAHLSSEQVAQYEREGYLVLRDVFNGAEVQCFKDELERMRKDAGLGGSDEVIAEPGSGDIRSIFRVHSISPVFKRLAADVRLAGIAQGLLDDEVYIHQSRLNYKPGFRGKEFYWHSDFETWHVEDGMPAMRALSMSITLTENTGHNGPLMLMPGSHKSYAVCTGETPANHFKASLKKQEYGVPEDDLLAQLAGRNGIVSAVAKPGSVIIFDCNTMHGSNSNITPDPRSNVFFVYNAISNRVVQPFCDQSPRPEYIATREHVATIKPQSSDPESYRGELQCM